jgi:hypothetical protein
MLLLSCRGAAASYADASKITVVIAHANLRDRICGPQELLLG